VKKREEGISREAAKPPSRNEEKKVKRSLNVVRFAAGTNLTRHAICTKGLDGI
jgi:hypothetical protein